MQEPNGNGTWASHLISCILLPDAQAVEPASNLWQQTPEKKTTQAGFPAFTERASTRKPRKPRNRQQPGRGHHMSRLCPSGLREMKWRQPDVNQLQTIKDPVSYGPRDWDSNIACRTVLTPSCFRVAASRVQAQARSSLLL